MDSTSDHAASTDPRRSIFPGGTRDPFGAYHDLYANGSTILRTDDAFSAAVTAYAYPGLLLFDRQVTGAVHQRDIARVRRDGFDHYNLQVLRSGRMSGGAWGGERTLSPGDAMLFDTTRPQRTSVAAADYLTVALPRDVVEATLPDARRFHGIVLPYALSKPLHDVVMVLAHRPTEIDVVLAARPDRLIVDLLTGIAGGLRGPAPDDRGGSAMKRLRATAFIDAHLGRSDLDVAAVAAGTGLSRSALYRAFASAGGVEREIQRRRLARLRAAILQPGETRSLASLAGAFGFADESHCSRAFKAAYGSAPNHLRAEVTRARDDRGRRLDARRMREWFDEMRPEKTGAARPRPA